MVDSKKIAGVAGIKNIVDRVCENQSIEFNESDCGDNNVPVL